MEKYITPEMELIMFDNKDVVITSGDCPDDCETYGFDEHVCTGAELPG